MKQILIDRKVPRAARSSLPLLLIGEAIAWVPGITIDERFRVEETQNEVWIAQIRTA